MRKANQVEHLPGGVTAIFLKHKGQVLQCLIDTTDYDQVKGFRWCAWRHGRTFCAATTRVKKRGGRTTAYLHRLLFPGVAEIDHRNGDPLDNRRSNLRPASRAQNNANTRKYKNGMTSRFKGVCFDKFQANFRATIQVNRRQLCLGRFDSEEEAARAYNRAALEHFGEFARLNWLEPLSDKSEPGQFVPRKTVELVVEFKLIQT